LFFLYLLVNHILAIFRPPFAYNLGAPISGTTQYGDFVVGNNDIDYSNNYGGVQWWASPEESTGYIIGDARPGGQPVPSGVTGTAQVGFFRSKGRTDQAFLDLANYIGAKNGQPTFTTTNQAEVWLESNGYYTSFNLPTPTPTTTNTPTPTMTPTPSITASQTITPTNTASQTQTPTPSITASQTVTETPTQTQTGTAAVTPTITPTNTQTPSVTPSVSPTTTTTPTPTRTSSTPTPTATLTQTPSPTPYTTLAGSLLFNGSNQSLGISPGVTFGAGTFTLEGWFYNTSDFNSKGIIGSPVSSPTGCMNLYFGNNTTITSDKNGGGGSFSYTMATPITINQWHYLIYNRNADGTTAVYIDGVRAGGTVSDTLNYSTATDTIGRYYGGYWPGYWTNMRMTIGTAVYNSTLTTQATPRGPLTSLANTKYLMLGAVVTTDSSGTQTVTNNNGVTQTSDEPF
jgi:hypothetical protein